MTSSLHHKLAAAVVAVAGLAVTCSAQAATYEGNFFVNFAFGPGLSQYAVVTDFFDGGVAGDTFIDDYVFQAPPAYADVKASFYSNLLSGGASEVSFSSVTLSYFQPGEDTSYLPLTVASSPVSLSGASTSSVPSGVYVFEISGTLLVNNAQYAGIVNTNDAPIPLPAVPEPTTAWLLGLGLAGVGVAMRKRQQAV